MIEKRKEQIKIIDGAIEQCRELIKGNPVYLRGLHNFVIRKGKVTDEDLNNRIENLMIERERLMTNLKPCK